MKKSTLTIFFTLVFTSVFADGQNLDGLVWYVLGYALLFFVAPLLILTILSLRNHFRPGKGLLGIALGLLLVISIVDIYFFVRFKDVASNQRAGVAYILGLVFFITVVATNILLLYFGYRKSQSGVLEIEISERALIEKSNSKIDLLAVLALAFWFVSDIASYVLQKTIDNWSQSPAMYFQIVSSIIFAFIPIIFALVVRNNTLRLIAIVIGSILTIFMLYQNFVWFLTEFNQS